MASCNDGVDYVSAPADYAALFDTYYVYVVNLVRKHGIENQYKEDVAHELLLRFIEVDGLRQFNGNLQFSYKGEIRPARFMTYLTKFVLAYMPGKRDKQRRYKETEILLCDVPYGYRGQYGETGKSWLERYGEDPVRSRQIDMTGDLEARELLQHLRDYIAALPRRSKADQCDLLALFDEVVRQIYEDGAWSVAELRKKFPVSPVALHTWMWRLRYTVAEAADVRPPAKRPRTVRK